MKKIFYIIVALVLIAIFLGLVFFRLKDSKVEKPIVSKLIVPVSKNKKNTSETDEQSKNELNYLETISLESNEVIVTKLDIDLNLDGFDDKVLVVLRVDENVIYLIPSLNDPITKTYNRGDAVRLEGVQKANLSVSALDLGLDKRPALICSGVSSANSQVAIMFLTEGAETSFDKKFFSLKQVAFFTADLQIRINKNEKAKISGLDLYRVSCFDVDQANPNTLTQIEKIYAWSEIENSFQKVDEKIIPGEKIENEMLRRIGSGNVKLFREFLQGLWTQTSTEGLETEKLFYFNDSDNEITFTDGSLQEIYVISSFTQRRYGIYFTTYNKSLTNIILRVDIEIKNMSEIKINVTERVTRLKIGAESFWDGTYKKKDNTIQNEILTNIETVGSEFLLSENVIWKNDNYELSVNANNFAFKTPQEILTGNFTIFKTAGKNVLQLRNGKTQRFYEITKLKNTITLEEVEVRIDSLKSLGKEKIVLQMTKLNS